MSLASTFTPALAIALAVVLVSGCSYFEVAEQNMPDGHDGAPAEMHDTMHDHGEETPAIQGAPETRVTADAMAFEPASLELAVGKEHNLTLHSVDILHDLTIDEVDFHVAAEAGEETTGGLVFPEDGTWIAYCAIPGHRQAGMKIEITVR